MIIEIRRSSRGQILLPLLWTAIIFVAFLMMFIQWGKHKIYQMRLELTADAVALSTARAEAEMLNTICFYNATGNVFYVKGKVPFVDAEIAAMKWETIPKFERWQSGLQKLVRGFAAYPASVGFVVARENHAVGLPVLPIKSLLTGHGMFTAIIIESYPFVIPSYFSDAYVVRNWQLDKLKAQPTHTTMWVVSGQGEHAAAKAGLWLDVQRASLAHNGGFPRPHESWVRDLGVQSFYPQFNARLLPRPTSTIDTLLSISGRSRG